MGQLITVVEVVGGPHEADIAIGEESVRRYYANESDDPVQIIERKEEEERILKEW